MVWTAAVGLALTVWLAASLVNQLAPPWWAQVSRHDRFGLLPRWRFFAPNPGRDDHHLVIRDQTAGTVGPWRAIASGEEAGPWRWLWHPSRFRRKALTDLIVGLMSAIRFASEAGSMPGPECLSVSYLGLLRWAMTEPAEEGTRRQFAVVASQGHGQPRSLRVIYVSMWHSTSSDDER